MAYPYPGLFAIDPKDPGNVASDALVTISDPADPAREPIDLFDSEGLPIDNPLVTNSKGYIGVFYCDLDEVLWSAAGLEGLIPSFQGMKEDARKSADRASSAEARSIAAEANSEEARAAAEAAANLVDAPADNVIASLIGNGDSKTVEEGDRRWLTDAGGDARYLRVVKSSTPPFGQVTYHWEGVPHFSASVKKVDGVVVERNLCRNPGIEAFRPGDKRPLILALGAADNAITTFGGGAVVEASAEWADGGEQSCKVASTGSKAGALYIWGASQTPETLGIERNVEYTLSATVHLGQALTSPTHQYSRALNIAVDSGSGNNFDFAVSNIPANEPGTYRVAVSFMIGDDIEKLTARCLNGSTTVGDAVYFDSFKLSDSYDTEYFDGDTMWDTTLWQDGDAIKRWDGARWIPTNASRATTELGWLDEMKVLTRWNMYDSDTVNMYLQGFSIDTERQLIYCAYGRGADDPNQRFEIRDYDGNRVSYREIAGEPLSYTEGIAWWYDGSALKMIVRVDASSTATSLYRVYNYSTDSLGQPVQIKGKVRGEVLGNYYVASDAYGYEASEFYIYDWGSVKAGTPNLLATIPLERSGSLDFKVQATTATRDYLFIYGATPPEPPTVLVFNWQGRFIGARRWDHGSFKNAVNGTYPGIAYSPTFTDYESEGMCNIGETHLALGHAYWNSATDGRQFMITMHGLGGVKASHSLLYQGT